MNCLPLHKELFGLTFLCGSEENSQITETCSLDSTDFYCLFTASAVLAPDGKLEVRSSEMQMVSNAVFIILDLMFLSYFFKKQKIKPQFIHYSVLFLREA